ncbi:hypothetical protein CsSME_00033034 [Camellia sinensis var. sinensis]
MATASSSSSSASSGVTERRGIPAAAFVEDVHTYLSQLGLDVNSALSFLQERFLFFPYLSLYLSTLFHICLGLYLLDIPMLLFDKPRSKSIWVLLEVLEIHCICIYFFSSSDLGLIPFS